MKAKDFLGAPKKAITLIGMSGAGKSHISCQMEKWGWHVYSCDYEIGSKYLKDELDGSFSAEDISGLSDYLGKLGSPEKGGFLLNKFVERQGAYYDAEASSLSAMGGALDLADGHFIHDSTGSLCEIEDEELMKKIGALSLFVYLKAGEEEEAEVLKRAREYPKPLFFPPEFLAHNLNVYLSDHNISSVKDMEPDEFARWVFPKLFDARKPKYQRLADLYGVTIPANEFRDLKSAQEFVEIIAKYMDK